MLSSRTLTAILSSATLLCLGSRLRADDRLQRVVENVRANEAIFQNIEAEVTQSYKLNTNGATAPPPYAFKSASKKTRTVLQGRFVYFRKDAQVVLVDNTTPPQNSIMGYDGEYTRRVDGQVANLIHAPYGHCELFRPHTWLLPTHTVCFPLSLWLAGGKELQNHPGAGQYKDNWVQQVYYEKEELVDGLHTVKLRGETKERSGDLNSVWFLWLAIDRNYLPVKTEGFGARYSKTLPLEVGRATDFREAAPGVWLPFHNSIVVYDEMKVAQNKVAVANTRETTLTKVDLNPRYDISLFRDIPIPDGTLVYEVKDGKIFNKYTQGEETSPHWTARKPWRWWWLVGLIVGLLLLTGGWAAYRWHSGRRNRAQAA